MSASIPGSSGIGAPLFVVIMAMGQLLSISTYALMERMKDKIASNSKILLFIQINYGYLEF